MDKIQYISLYTEGLYEKVINKYLLPSLKQFDLPYKLYRKPDLRNWEKNTVNYKAQIILDALKEFNKTIVFLDADAVINSFPHLFYTIPNKYEIGYHLVDWHLQYNKTSNIKQLATGTLWINNTENTKNFIKKWILLNSKTKYNEQFNLETIIKNNNINSFILPVEYCAIVNFKNVLPDYIKNPVITHFQASRKYKGKFK